MAAPPGVDSAALLSDEIPKIPVLRGYDIPGF
jgi:hypothetical protein